MIFTERTITVVNDSATINKPLILYRGDKNIELKITIVESQFKFRSTGASNVIETANASYAQLVINTPYNSPIFSEVTATENGTVIFVISAAMIDEVREVGIYDIQIRLLDDNKQSRVTIPPVSNAIEIREPMAIEDGSPIDSNVVNVAKVNRALTTTSAPLEAFDSQGNYIKKTWGDGDPITDAALNKMEAGIDGVNKKVAKITETQLGGSSSQIKDVTNIIEVTQGADVTLGSNVKTQTVNITWNVPLQSGMSFTNFLTRSDSNNALPKTISNYNSPWKLYVVEDNIVLNNVYFLALRVTKSEDASYTLFYSAPIKSHKENGEWKYALICFDSNATTNSIFFKDVVGTVQLVNAYAIDVQGAYGSKTGSDETFLNELIDLYGGLDLVPGQNYEGTNTDSPCTLTSYSNDTILDTAVYGTDTEIDVVANGRLSITKGKAVLRVVSQELVDSSSLPSWSGIKWACIGDSLTDSTINATKKYHKIIAEKTGITVQELAKGGTGYTAGYDSSNTFYDRISSIDSDADIVTLFGSVNDWKNTQYTGLCKEIGTASDVYDNSKTVIENTFCANLNKTFDALFAKVPTAQVIVFGAMPYYGVNYTFFEQVRKALIDVCASRHITYVDMFDSTGFYRIMDNADYATAYTTDFAGTNYDSSTPFGHPNNTAHEKIVAPLFLAELKKHLPIV